MKTTNYHHEDLRNDLIQAGLKLLNEEGYENFSLRKVAKFCHVSHTAPYRHFKNKDDLVTAITAEAIKKFDDALQAAVDKYPDHYEQQLREMGFCYVKFFVENPDYLQLLFIRNVKKYAKLDCQEERKSPFLTFFHCEQKLLAERKIVPEEIHAMVLSHWSLVHGLALIITNRDYPYDGNYMELVRKIIFERLVINR